MNSDNQSELRGGNKGDSFFFFFTGEEIRNVWDHTRCFQVARAFITLYSLCGDSLWCVPTDPQTRPLATDKCKRGGWGRERKRRGDATVVRSKCRFSTRWNSWRTATGWRTPSLKISVTAKRRPTWRTARRRPTANPESCSWV